MLFIKIDDKKQQSNARELKSEVFALVSAQPEQTGKATATEMPGSESESESRSRSRSQRPDYKIEPVEGVDAPESAEDDEYREDEESEVVSGNEAEEEEGEQEEEEEEAGARTRRSSRRTKRKREDESESEGELESEGEIEVMDEKSATPTPSATPSAPHTKISSLRRSRPGYPVDADHNAIPVVNEEYQLPDDPQGDQKISSDGDLLAPERTFKVRTFTLFDKGDRKFMLATEPARAVGLRDSHLFFLYHANLYKYILSQTQKNDLISRSILPYSYRSRQIAVATARSVFKEFGHEIIQDGVPGEDDYYSDPCGRNTLFQDVVPPARDTSSTRRRERPPRKASHHPAITTNASNTNANGISAEPLQGKTMNPARNAVEFFDRGKPGLDGQGIETGMESASATAPASTNSNNQLLNSTNWLYQHAAACSRFNSDMYYDRVRILLIENQGVRDPYTNTLHVPGSTQASRVLKYARVEQPSSSGDGRIVYETRLCDGDALRTRTGLSHVKREVYEALVDAETLQAIDEQIAFERG